MSVNLNAPDFATVTGRSAAGNPIFDTEQGPIEARDIFGLLQPGDEAFLIPSGTWVSLPTEDADEQASGIVNAVIDPSTTVERGRFTATTEAFCFTPPVSFDSMYTDDIREFLGFASDKRGANPTFVGPLVSRIPEGIDDSTLNEMFDVSYVNDPDTLRVGYYQRGFGINAVQARAEDSTGEAYLIPIDVGVAEYSSGTKVPAAGNVGAVVYETSLAQPRIHAEYAVDENGDLVFEFHNLSGHSEHFVARLKKGAKSAPEGILPGVIYFN